MRAHSVAAAALLAVTAPACAPAAQSGQLADTKAKLEASDRARGAQARRIEELEDRIFLLTDKLESQKVAMGRRGADRPPELPVVALAPPGDAEPAGEPYDPPAAEPMVEAPRAPAPMVAAPTRARTPVKRRALHLEGTPAIAAGDGLGVVKLPDKGVPLARDERKIEAPDPEPLKLYREAYAKLMAGRAAEAEADFRDFVRRWPRHDYADNAQYWLGESLYTRRDYTLAAPEFQQVVARWPSGNKAPDALLKLGYCLLSLGDKPGGRLTLEQVRREYPRTEAAHLAGSKLAELPPEERK